MLMHCNISCLPLNALHLSLFPLSRDTCMEEIETEEGCAREKERDRERQRETCVYTMLTTSELVQVCCMNGINGMARLAQSAERKALNLVVVGSSPTVGAY